LRSFRCCWLVLSEELLDHIRANTDGALRRRHGWKPTVTNPPTDGLGMSPEGLGDLLDCQ